MYGGFHFSFGSVALGREVLGDILRSDPACHTVGPRAAERGAVKRPAPRFSHAF